MPAIFFAGGKRFVLRPDTTTHHFKMQRVSRVVVAAGGGLLRARLANAGRGLPVALTQTTSCSGVRIAKRHFCEPLFSPSHFDFAALCQMSRRLWCLVARAVSVLCSDLSPVVCWPPDFLTCGVLLALCSEGGQADTGPCTSRFSRRLEC